jgi:hypothetical protein
MIKKSLHILFFLFIFLLSFDVLVAQKTKPKKTPKIVTVARPVAVPIIDPEETPPPPKATPKPTPRPSSIKTGVFNEKYSINFTVNDDATFVKETEIIKRFDENPQSEYAFSKYYDEFNSSLEKIEVIEATIIKADGSKTQLSKEKSKIEPTPQTRSAPEYSSTKMLTIDYSEVKKGDRILLKLKETTFKSVFQNIFNSFLLFSPFEAYQSAEINFKVPLKYNLKFDVNDFKGGKISEEGKNSLYQWKLENYKAKNYEAGMGTYFNFAPRLLATNVKDFNEIGHIFLSEVQDKIKITPEIQQLADEITKDKNTDEEKINAIYEWVNKNIRYLSVIIDRGGWIPHSSTQILQNGFGDCKDYTILLHTFLKAKNIESYPMVVRMDSTEWFASIPTLHFFNHMILYIPSLKKFADATIPNSKLGEVSDLIKGKKGVLFGATEPLIDLPPKNKKENSSSSFSKVSLLENGNIKSITEISFNQNPALLGIREKLDSETKSSFRFIISLLFSQFGVNGTGDLLEVTRGKDENEPTKLKVETVLNSFVKFEEKGGFEVPPTINFANWKAFESILEVENRTTDLRISEFETFDSFEIVIPNGVKIESIPQNISLENELAKYVSEFKLENNVVYVKRTLQIKKKVIQTVEFPQFKELLKKGLADVKAKITYSVNDEFKQKNIIAKSDKTKENKEDTKNNAENIAKSIFDNSEEVTLANVSDLEKTLDDNPNDESSHRKLIIYYDKNSETFANRRESIKHKLWFIENHPDSDFLNGFEVQRYYEAKDKEYIRLRDAWLKKLGENPKNIEIRKQISQFVKNPEPELAKKILFEGEKIVPENYKVCKLLFDLLIDELDDAKDNKLDTKKKNELIEQIYLYGTKTWHLTKSDRTYQATSDRGNTLVDLIEYAFDLGKIVEAKKMATELILEYEDNDNAVHIGNIILGRIALKENNIAKAKEYLAISIDVPLNARYEYLSNLDLKLAEELLKKGEKTAVIDYLEQCKKLRSIKGGYGKVKISQLTQWQINIKAGKPVSFKQ